MDIALVEFNNTTHYADPKFIGLSQDDDDDNIVLPHDLIKS